MEIRGMEMLDSLLRKAISLNASDVHIDCGTEPGIRINGVLQKVPGFEKYNPEVCQQIFNYLLRKSQRSEIKQKYLDEDGDVNLIYSIHGKDGCRFRVNAFLQRGSFSFSFRILKNEVPTIEELNLPPILKKIAAYQSGLVIVTGPAGQGKSTTLAAVINFINRNFTKNIITLEDPIEFLHRHDKSRIVQRERMHDFYDFSHGLKATLRQDPNVVMVGEMLDGDTIMTALSAAETGHLVLSTLHTASASKAIDRIIDSVPAIKQQQVKAQLAVSLKAVIWQKLLPRIDGNGRIPAVEVLIGGTDIANLIREGKNHNIPGVIETSASRGMISMEKAIANLVQKKLISPEYEASFEHYSLPGSLDEVTGPKRLD